MTWRHKHSNQNISSVSCLGNCGYTKEESRYESNQNLYQLLVFKKSIKIGVSQYIIVKDEKYFEAFKRNLLATAHDCEEILNGDYKPKCNDDSQELFKQKQFFVYSVLNKVLQSDMGKR